MAKRKASNICSTSKKPYEETGFIIKSEDDFIIMDNEDEESECFETVNRSRNKNNQNVTCQGKQKSPMKKVPKLNEDENINVLYNCLSELRPKSPLVLNGIAHEIKNFPIVELKNFGEIKLPLKKAQAEELIKTSYRTSTGPDNQLILINKHVRDASHLLIRNPEWSSQLAQLVVRIAKQLGCGEGSEIEARLSEVFLYTKDSSRASVVFKDEWSESGMFGKLLIQLPSRFTGGKHNVCDDNGFVNKTLVFGQNDSSTHSNIYFAAYLNGLEHDVMPITSGHRLILVYSLYSDREEKSFLQKNESTIERLSVALSAMSEQSYRLGIVLENTYKPELLVGNGFKALQKIDAFRYELLNHANICIPRNRRVAFYTCFAYLTVTSQDSSKKFSRDSQIDIDALKDQTFKWKETSRTIEFRNWTDANGQILFENHTFEQQFFSKVIRPNIKNSLDFDWSDLNTWGPVYNEELFFEPVKHPPVPPLKILKNKSTYSRCLLVCLPEAHEFDIFFSTSLSCTIDLMFNLIVNGSEVANLQDFENFERMLNEWENKNNPIYKLSPSILTQYKKKVSMIIDKIGSKSRLSNNKPPVVKLENISDNDEMLLPSPSPLVNKSRKKSAHKITSPNTTTSINKVVWDQSSLRKGVKNLVKNLDIIRSLYENQQTEEALTVFQNYILPLIVDENEFVKISMNSSEISDEDLTNINVNEPLRENYKHESTFFSIAKVTVNLSKRSTNSAQTLVDLLDDFTKMLVKHLDADSMKLLVEELMSEWETFEDVPPIRSLIGFRCQWLENHIEPNLEFTWCMPEARFEQHAVIESFLHSNRKIMSYVGEFATFKDALEFCRRFERASGLASGFTVKLEPCGIKPDSPISITKTIDYFEQKRLRNEAFTQELANLVDILNRNSSPNL